jgi:fatty acid CoA ligase FadD9
MPISRIRGRTVLYSTLSMGGTAYFTAESDLSTLLEDLSLVRPTSLDLVPRLWETLFQEVQSEVDHRWTDGDRGSVERQVMTERRENLIGGRQFCAMTGGARISPELSSWVEEFLDIHLMQGYGSTEDGVVMLDGLIRRPPVIDYQLVDVPELGYFANDRPHPRGELWIKSTHAIPGYYKRPEVAAEHFDSDGWYRTGDVMAEIGPGRAGLRRSSQQRAQALAGRVRHHLPVGGSLRRSPGDTSDLRLGQQLPVVSARGDRPHRRRARTRRW